MSYAELLILAISLTFDTFAVSISGGISLPNIKFSKKAIIMAFFGVFQALYLFIGWFVGGKFAHFIVQWDHWVAFAILLYLGGKMLYEGIKNNDDEPGSVNLLSYKKIAVLATATSIDAIAVGVSLAFADIPTLKIMVVTVMTLVATMIASYIGLQGGRRLGNRVGSKASIWGGVILIFIGVRIVVEHLFF